MNRDDATFDSMGLNESLLRTIRNKKFTQPTPIQAETIPQALAGRDILGCAQTGTGKTAAFALPIIQRLQTGKPAKGSRPIRSLIVAPTRELAAQIGQALGEFSRKTGLRHTVIFGGVNQRKQCTELRRGVDILVATPGRLLDLANQGKLKLSRVEILVLDEADRMLDMGFLPDIRRIMKLVPDQRQTLLFSATMPKEIKKMSGQLLDDPFTVTIAPETPAADTVRQQVQFVQNPEKMTALKDILACPSVTKAIVFARTKRRADKIARQLDRASIAAAAMHSNKSQNQRRRTLGQLKSGALRVLVASDIASRGIDVSDISHVFNYDMPNDAETYVHRIGRTGRAGTEGRAVSFCSSEEVALLSDIEKLLTRELPIRGNQPRPAEGSGTTARPGRSRGKRSKNRNSSSNRSSNSGARTGSRPRNGRRRRQLATS
ncbi:MAG: DEAD/DEAH box helicase [Phycisphaerae bacterium]